MNLRMIPLTLAVSLALVAGCKESSSETSRDVAEARVEAAESNDDAREDAAGDMADASGELAEARQDYREAEGDAHDDLNASESEAMVAAAHARYDVMHTAAQGRHKVAMERCDGMARGEERDACETEADGVLAVGESEAEQARDEALLAASRHQ